MEFEANRDDASIEQLKKYAGLSDADFKACLQKNDLIKGIQASIKEATDKYKVRSVPAFLIGTKKQIESGNAKRINGAVPFETFDRVINEALADAGKK